MAPFAREPLSRQQPPRKKTNGFAGALVGQRVSVALRSATRIYGLFIVLCHPPPPPPP